MKEIDHVIDQDIKSEITKFNPDQNGELRMKILSLQSSCMPLRDLKLTRMIDNMIENFKKNDNTKEDIKINALELGNI